jgi:hypothetical protein
MLDLKTLELILLDLILLALRALPEAIAVGCKTARSGVPLFYPGRRQEGKNTAGRAGGGEAGSTGTDGT